jgi:hypothetical protein
MLSHAHLFEVCGCNSAWTVQCARSNFARFQGVDKLPHKLAQEFAFEVRVASDIFLGHIREATA